MEAEGPRKAVTLANATQLEAEFVASIRAMSERFQCSPSRSCYS
jgi:hypothetical protein